MARPGFIEARDALQAAERSLKSAERELVALQALDDSDESSRYLKEARIATHVVYLNRYRAELDAAKTAFAQFDRKKGPKFVRQFPRNYVVNVSLTKEVGDLLEQENSKGRSLSDIVRCALTEYLLPKASDAPDAPEKPYVPF